MEAHEGWWERGLETLKALRLSMGIVSFPRDIARKKGFALGNWVSTSG